MKKIKLVLCACAVAMVGLLTSCQQGAQEVLFDQTINHRSAYTVTGSLGATFTYGTKGSENKAVKNFVISSGAADVYWSESEVGENDSSWYGIDSHGMSGTLTSSVTPSGSTESTETTTYNADYDDDIDWNSYERFNFGNVKSFIWNGLEKFEGDDKYYAKFYDNYYPVTLSASPEDDRFTYTATVSIDKSDTTTTSKVVYTCNLTFKKVDAE